MSFKSTFSMILLVVLVVLGASSLYVVEERQVAVKRAFGEVVESDIKPGLHFKIPFVHTVLKFDARIQTLDSRPERFLTKEKKNVIVDSFVKWKIIDVKSYYKATAGDLFQAANLLSN